MEAAVHPAPRAPHPWWLRKSTPEIRKSDGESDFDRLRRLGADRHLLCRACGAPVTTLDQRLMIEGRHVHERVNPAGEEYVLGCFDDAPGTLVLGEPTAEFSWFVGYVWSFALCRRCNIQLGWFFEGRNPRFHGLILDQLVEETSDEEN